MINIYYSPASTARRIARKKKTKTSSIYVNRTQYCTLKAWLFCNTPGKKKSKQNKENPEMDACYHYVIISYKQFCRQIPCKTAERTNRISSQWIDMGRSRSERLHDFFIFMTEYTTFIWRNKSEVSPLRIQTRTLFFFFTLSCWKGFILPANKLPTIACTETVKP